MQNYSSNTLSCNHGAISHQLCYVLCTAGVTMRQKAQQILFTCVFVSQRLPSGRHLLRPPTVCDRGRNAVILFFTQSFGRASDILLCTKMGFAPLTFSSSPLRKTPSGNAFYYEYETNLGTAPSLYSLMFPTTLTFTSFIPRLSAAREKS